MPRRSHKKSRNGCLECKRRHIKCNESHPKCSNCIASERVCEYGINASTKPRLVESPRESAASASLSPATCLPWGQPSPRQGSACPDDGPVNMLHMELFYHLISDTLPGLDVQLGETDLVGLVPHLLKAPYMVNELLAFSALHLSTRHPERCKYYRTQATQLQTHAIANFQEGGLVIDQETCVPAVMFSSIVGLHALCDALVHREKDFAHFVDKFVHCFRLHLGVRTVFTEAWPMIRQSVLKPLLADVERQHHFDGRLGLGCAKLLRLVQAANLGDHLTSIYKQAIEQLQVSANVFIPSALAGSQFFGAGWPLLVCSEYNDLLLQRRPEALVILAHYAIMLQCCRGSWIVGDGGHYIIQSTRDWLGSEWAEWLEWAVTDVEDPVKLLLQVYG